MFVIARAIVKIQILKEKIMNFPIFDEKKFARPLELQLRPKVGPLNFRKFWGAEALAKID